MSAITTSQCFQANLGSMTLPNPVMPASGTFGYGQEYQDLVDLSALGAIVTKAVSVCPRAGNQPQRIWETDRGMLNTIGLQNDGVQAFIEQKLPYLRATGVPIVVNVVGETPKQYAQVVVRIEAEGGVDAYELNLSCPNVHKGCLQFGQEPEGIQTVVSTVREVTDRSLWVKLSPNVNDIRPLGQAAEQAGADVLVAINTLIGMAIDTKRRKPVLSMGSGGLSGPAIRPVGVRMVYQLYQSVDIPIVGVGGIMDTNDALEYLIAGASALQVGTANFVDPSSMQRIIEGLREYGVRAGIESWSEVIGAAHRE